MNATTSITEAEITNLVARFYEKVRVDPEIGPIFNGEVKNWDAHLALLKDFWSTVLLSTGRYKGNPLLAHFRLPMEERYFARWLMLFTETANDTMIAGHSEVVVQKANHIAMNMKLVLAFATDVPVAPVLGPATKLRDETALMEERTPDDDRRFCR